MRRKIALLATPVLALALFATGCGDNSSSSSSDEDEGGESSELCPGEEGCVPANQPDISDDGTVNIGVLSPGDINDGGYYEAFVVNARDFAEENDWEVTTVDRVTPGDAAQQALNLCRQGVDMIALGDSTLQDALPVAKEDVCSNTVFYIATSEEIPLDGYVFQTRTDVYESQTAAGYATGLVMQQLGVDKGGFVSGPDIDFVNRAYDSWTGGIKETIPNATFVKTLTGSMDDSAKAQEAVNAQISEGIGLIYPYLGGATDAAAQAAGDQGVDSVAPGTDRCSDPSYAVASLFSPGYVFEGVLEKFKNGEIVMGEVVPFKVGVDSVPSVEICPSVPNAAELQSQVDQFMDGIGSGDIDPQAIADNAG